MVVNVHLLLVTKRRRSSEKSTGAPEQLTRQDLDILSRHSIIECQALRCHDEVVRVGSGFADSNV